MSVEVALQVVGAAVWLIGELRAVANRRRGDTTTEMTATSRPLFVARGAVAVWLVVHFVAAPALGWPPAVEVASVAAGAAVSVPAWAAYQRRRTP